MAERTEIAATAVGKSPPRGPRAGLKRAAAALGFTLLAAAVAVALLPSAFWRWLIIHEVAGATGRPVAIDGNVNVHLFSLTPQITVEGLSVGNAPWAHGKNLLSVKKFQAGALLTPVAALLAFVDGGLAKDANCAALIGQAEQGKNLPQE